MMSRCQNRHRIWCLFDLWSARLIDQILMALPGFERSRCRMQVRCERELTRFVLDAMEHPRLITRTLNAHNLGMACEALAVNALVAFHRQRIGLRMEAPVVVASIHNVLQNNTKEPFIPTRPRLTQLNELAAGIAYKPPAPRPNPWQTNRAADA